MIKNNQIKIYKSKTGSVGLKVTMDRDTVWLSQKQMSELFNKDTNTIGEHIGNIFSERELTEKSVTRDFRAVELLQKMQQLGKNEYVPFWNISKFLGKCV